MSPNADETRAATTGLTAEEAAARLNRKRESKHTVGG